MPGLGSDRLLRSSAARAMSVEDLTPASARCCPAAIRERSRAVIAARMPGARGERGAGLGAAA